MKSLILFLALSAGFAHAATAPSNICGKLFPCGTYQALDSTSGHEVTRQIVLTAAGPNDVEFEFVTIDNGVRTVSSEIMNFRADGKGLFTMDKNGEPRGAGICSNDACSISTPPFLHNGEQAEQALVFRFSATALQLAKLYVDDKGGALHTNAIFNKLP